MKFLVAFKGYKKYQIMAPDENRAKEWAERQLAFWKRDFKATVTPIVEEKAVVEEKAE
jgi:hypothetical protein